MLDRLRNDEDGFGLIELSMAMMILTIALLVLVAGYDSAAVSLHDSAEKTVASSLADAQIELYNALPYASIGLDQTRLAGIETSGGAGYDSRYVSDEAALDNAANASDTTIANCGSTPQCLPIQTVTGSDHRSYRIETFIRDVQNNISIRWTVREVTIVVQDPSQSGTPELVRETAAFDRGP
jgi:prepilin-type N-terminal cleavage/methylation domain-containing protein